MTDFGGHIVGKHYTTCPYRGLFAFREDDAPFFFGREEFTAQTVAAVQQQTLVAIIGASGSGKSSIVFAGLKAQLCRSKTCLVTDFRPGSSPFYSLAAALAPLLEVPQMARDLQRGNLRLYEAAEQFAQEKTQTTRVVLIVDQFEELYSLCPEQELRGRFLDVLLEAVEMPPARATTQLALVLTMRVDFLGQALAHRPFTDVLQRHTLMLGPMNRTELRRAIENPAHKQGVKFEPGLVERILDDVGDQPGNLPLLEFALMSLWERRTGAELTYATYEEIGRIEGALARYAENIYHGLNSVEKDRARRVFIQMVRPGEGTEDTRRLATRAELGEGDWALAQGLADARLAVTGRNHIGQETVEVAHEALIRGWDRLQDWMNADRAFRVWQERLRVVLRQWRASGQDEGALLRGVVLAEAEGWLTTRGGELSSDEQEFIQMSIALRERGKAAQTRLRRITLLSLSVGLVIALALAAFAFVQWQRAEEQRQVVEAQRRVALSHQLAAQSLNYLDGQDFDLALLLSMEAQRISDTLEARSSLLTALERSPYLAIWRHPAKLSSNVLFSPDGKQVVSGNDRGKLVIWDVARREAADQAAIDAVGAIDCLAISPDGQTLAVGNANGQIVLWDMAKGAIIGEPLTSSHRAVQTLTFSPDGAILAAGNADYTITLWDVATGVPAAPPLKGHTGEVTSLDFSPNGKILASGAVDQSWGGVDKNVLLWDVATGKRRGAALASHDGDITDVDFSPDGKLLASGSQDGKIILWDVAEQQPIGQPLIGHADDVGAIALALDVQVAFSPDGRTLAAGYVDGTVIFWDMLNRQPRGQPLSSHTEGITSLEFSANGQMMVSASLDNTIVLWATRQPVGHILNKQGRGRVVWSVAFSPNEPTLAAGYADGTIALWDLTTSQRAGEPLTGHTNVVDSLAFSGDGATLASGSQDGTIILWDIARRQPRTAPLVGHTDGVNSVAFSADGWMLASGSRDNTVILWDVETGAMLGQPLTAHEDGVWSVAFSPDSKTLASGSWDETVILWDIITRQPLRAPLFAHQGSVTHVAFSPDGQLLASSSQDKTVILWDVETGQPRGEPLGGPPDVVWNVAFSPDGQMLASGGCGKLGIYSGCNQGEIRLWDVATGRPIGQPFTNHTSWVYDLAFSPDGQLLASGSDDTTIILWDVNPGSWRDFACTITRRNLTPAEWEQYLGAEPYRKTCTNLP